MSWEIKPQTIWLGREIYFVGFQQKYGIILML